MAQEQVQASQIEDLATSKITSGTFDNARISESSVTQHADAVDQTAVTSGAGAPASAPTYIGERYIDTSNNNAYIATGTASSADWEQIDAAGSGDAWSDAVDANIVPTGADSTYDIGSDTDRFANIYADRLNAGEWQADGDQLNLYAASATSSIIFSVEKGGFTPANFIRFFSADSGGSPYAAAQGSDTNIDFEIKPKGTGNATVNGSKIIDVSDKTGADANVVSGTAGTSGNLAEWNADGDVVDGPTPPTGDIVGTTDTQTVTNKRIQPRTSSQASSASLTPDVSSASVYYQTAQAAALTLNAPTGTPVTGEIISVNIKDDGTSRSLTFNSTYKFMGAAAPSATTSSKWLTVTAQYTGSEWLTTFAEEQ